MVTEQEVEDVKKLVRRWADCLVYIQCTKPPDVVKRTIELLAEAGENRDANLLRGQ